MPIRFGMIGGGIMGEALISRLLGLGHYRPDEIWVSEPLPARRQYLETTYRVQTTSDNRSVVTAVPEILMLAIKPQVLDTVAPDLSQELLLGEQAGEKPLMISILAGISLQALETRFPNTPIVRAMPNTPATVGAGITAITPGGFTSSDQLRLARQIFEAVGEVVEVPESLMDAVTGLSGSGPAFIALVVEALADGGVAAGLPRPIAAQLALKTVQGTAQLLQETGWHPAELKDRVTSPGGTTIAGIAQLERSGFRSALIEAVRAAYQRSCELGKH